jgi:hypothetical protein
MSKAKKCDQKPEDMPNKPRKKSTSTNDLPEYYPEGYAEWQNLKKQFGKPE